MSSPDSNPDGDPVGPSFAVLSNIPPTFSNSFVTGVDHSVCSDPGRSLPLLQILEIGADSPPGVLSDPHLDQVGANLHWLREILELLGQSGGCQCIIGAEAFCSVLALG